jgi:hypothetical protein
MWRNAVGAAYITPKMKNTHSYLGDSERCQGYQPFSKDYYIIT